MIINNRKFIGIITVLLISVSLVFLYGCGGGGGEDDFSYNWNSEEKKDSGDYSTEVRVQNNGTFALFSANSGINVKALEANTLNAGLLVTLEERLPNQTETSELIGIGEDLLQKKTAAGRFSASGSSVVSEKIYRLCVSDNGISKGIARLDKPISIILPNKYNNYERLFFAYRTNENDDFSIVEFADYTYQNNSNSFGRQLAVKTGSELKIELYSVNLSFTLLAVSDSESVGQLNSIKQVTFSALHKIEDNKSIIQISSCFTSENLWDFTNPKVTNRLIFFTEKDESTLFSSLKINGEKPVFSAENSLGNGYKYRNIISVNSFLNSDICVSGNMATWSFSMGIDDVDYAKLPDYFVVESEFTTSDGVSFMAAGRLMRPELKKEPQPIPDPEPEKDPSSDPDPKPSPNPDKEPDPTPGPKPTPEPEIVAVIATVIEPSVQVSVASNTSIIIKFSEKINWQESYNQYVTLKGIAPKIECNFTFDAVSNTLIIKPSSVLDYKSIYTVTITEFQTEEESPKKVCSYMFSFRTELTPSELKSISTFMVAPVNITEAATSTPVVLCFSYDIDWTDSCRSMVVLTNNDTTIECNYSYDSLNKRLTLVPMQPLSYSNTYTLSVLDGLYGKNGYMAETDSYNFTTMPVARATAVAYIANSSPYPGKSTLQPSVVINFNKPVKSTELAAGAIEIYSAEAVPEPVKIWNSDNSCLTLSWSENLTPNAEYRITMTDAVFDNENEEIVAFEPLSFSPIPFEGNGTSTSPFIVAGLLRPLPDMELLKPGDSVIGDVAAILSCFEGIELSDSVEITTEKGSETITRANNPSIVDLSEKTMTICNADNTFWPVDASFETKVAFSGTYNGEKIYFVSDKQSYSTSVYSGEGTEESPYLIFCPYQLDYVRNNLSAAYKLIADIDLSYENYQSETNTHDYGWIALGKSASPFRGIFDGNGKTIDRMVVNNFDESMDGIGLFGYVTDCRITNLTIGNKSYISSGYIKNENTYKSVGGIAAFANLATNENSDVVFDKCVNYAEINSNSSFYVCGIIGVICGNTHKVYITDCHNYGNVYSDAKYTAGICSSITTTNHSSVTVKDCSNNAKITTMSNYSGGIIGEFNGEVYLEDCINNGIINAPNSYTVGGIAANALSSSKPIKNCINKGKVIGRSSVGGITGYAVIAINGCANMGEIIAESDRAAGITAYTTNKIENSYNIANITAQKVAGGIVSYFHSDRGISMSGCYNVGNIVTTDEEVGGLAGCIIRGSITDCYNVGSVTSVNNKYAGGLVGSVRIGNNGTSKDVVINNCYLSCEIKGSSTNAGLVVGYVTASDSHTLTIADTFVVADTKINSVSVTSLDKLAIENGTTTAIKNNNYLLTDGYKSTINAKTWSSQEHWSDSDIWILSDSANPTLVTN